MIHAFIMLNVESGSEENVLKSLKPLNVVEEAYVSYGVYDVILKIKAENMDELKNAIIHKIRATDQIQSTLTLVVTEEKADTSYSTPK